jgi:hypothetical protein
MFRAVAAKAMTLIPSGQFFRDLTEFITERSFASTRELADASFAGGA